MLALAATVAGRESPAPAASGAGEPTHEAGGDGVSAAPVSLPGGREATRVQAITTLCTGAYHLSKQATQTVMVDLSAW